MMKAWFPKSEKWNPTQEKTATIDDKEDHF
jgi:hypothetical protein